MEVLEVRGEETPNDFTSKKADSNVRNRVATAVFAEILFIFASKFTDG